MPVSGRSRLAATCLEVGRLVHLRRSVVALQGALEWRSSAHRSSNLRLAVVGAGVVHEAVLLVLVLLAAKACPPKLETP